MKGRLRSDGGPENRQRRRREARARRGAAEAEAEAARTRACGEEAKGVSDQA